MSHGKKIGTSQRTNGCGQAARPCRGLAVRAALRGGKIVANHDQNLAVARGLGVRSALRAGKITLNHTQVLLAIA